MVGGLEGEVNLEREEILRHKWIESEKAGYDIGFERALLDWNCSLPWSTKQASARMAIAICIRCGRRSLL